MGLGCPAPVPTVEEEPASGTCSLCATRLDAAAESDGEYEATSEGLGRETRNVILRLSITTFLISVLSRSNFEYFSSQGHSRQDEEEEDKSTCAPTREDR
jgi:hypothetical protein